MRIAIWGFGKPVVDTFQILKGTSVEVAYIKADYKRSNIDEFQRKLNECGLYEFYIDEIPAIKVDLIFTINYNRIISETILNEYSIVNYHVGLLPMWRGNSCNGWGIINGESNVGYTIHKMWPMLDAGPIYYQFAYPYIEGETYIKARLAMDNDFKKILPQLLLDIYDGKITERNQNGPYTYCTTFRPIDGVINWSESTDRILRRFYVFGPPLGTGLKFVFKGKEYSITKLSRIQGFAKSIGVPGSIVYGARESIWVKTGDTAISIDEIFSDGQKVDISRSFIIGQRL